MKRHACKLALFLLLGAIINVAVAWGLAWGCVRQAPYHGWGLTNDERVYELWRACAPSEWRNADVSSVIFQEYSGSGTLVRDVLTRGLDGSEISVAQIEAGWPSLSISGVWLSEGQPGPPYWKHRCVNAWHLDNPNGYPSRIVPLKPVNGGFGINTVFYAAILWLLFAFPFALRRRRRIKRGLCPACSYDLRGTAHDLCPECGVSFSSKRQGRRILSMSRRDTICPPASPALRAGGAVGSPTAMTR